MVSNSAVSSLKNLAKAQKCRRQLMSPGPLSIHNVVARSDLSGSGASHNRLFATSSRSSEILDSMYRACDIVERRTQTKRIWKAFAAPGE